MLLSKNFFTNQKEIGKEQLGQKPHKRQKSKVWQTNG